jgi:hypothetical protein
MIQTFSSDIKKLAVKLNHIMRKCITVCPEYFGYKAMFEKRSDSWRYIGFPAEHESNAVKTYFLIARSNGFWEYCRPESRCTFEADSPMGLRSSLALGVKRLFPSVHITLIAFENFFLLQKSTLFSTLINDLISTCLIYSMIYVVYF